MEVKTLKLSTTLDLAKVRWALVECLPDLDIVRVRPMHTLQHLLTSHNHRLRERLLHLARRRTQHRLTIRAEVLLHQLTLLHHPLSDSHHPAIRQLARGTLLLLHPSLRHRLGIARSRHPSALRHRGILLRVHPLARHHRDIHRLRRCHIRQHLRNILLLHLNPPLPRNIPLPLQRILLPLLPTLLHLLHTVLLHRNGLHQAQRKILRRMAIHAILHTLLHPHGTKLLGFVHSLSLSAGSCR